MKKIVLSVVLLLVAVIGTVLLINLNDTNNDSGNIAESTQSEDAKATTEKEFSVSPTDSESFIAQITGQTVDGNNYTAEIKHDEAGNTSYVGSVNDEDSFEIYVYEGRNIFCSEGACFEGPTALATNPIPRDQVSFNEEALTDYRDNASYIGKQSCGSMTCDAWEIKSEGYTGTLLIRDSNRIDSASWEGPEGSFEIAYIYDSVVVTLPENIQSIPAL